MPPWHADAENGTFENERRLTTEEKAVIARWADSWRARRRPEGPARRTDVRDWLEHRHARRGVHDDGGLSRPRQRHDRIRILHNPDELHRGQMAAGHRSAAWQSRARASRARLLPGAAGGRCRRSGRRSPRVQHAAQPHSAANERGIATRPRQRCWPAPAHRHLRAWYRTAGLSTGNGDAAPARRRHRAADALHGQWHGRHRPIEGRDDLREGAARNRDSRDAVSQRTVHDPARRSRSPRRHRSSDSARK